MALVLELEFIHGQYLPSRSLKDIFSQQFLVDNYQAQRDKVL